MVVTQIKETTKKKAEVWIDQEAAFTLYMSEIRKFRIEVGQELPQEVYDEITKQLLVKRAKIRAMSLLQSRDYTTKQLTDKLMQGGYGEKAVEQALEYVESFHYLDDYRYAKNYISYRLETKSRKKLEQELLLKGITFDTIRQVFDELSEDGQKSDEISMIISLLEKKKYNFEHPESKEIQRMYGFLSRKGFQQDAIYKVLFSKGKDMPFT